MATSGTVKKPELSFPLDAGTAYNFFNCLREEAE